MQAIRYLDAQAPDDAARDSFVAGSPEGHLLQTSYWGRLKSRYGWEVEDVTKITWQRFNARGHCGRTAFLPKEAK